MSAFRRLVRRMLRADADHRLRRDLDGVWVDGIDHLRDAAAEGPVIVAANHVAWWDGLLAQVLSDRAGVESGYLVDASTLQRLPFLAAFGALGVDRSGPGAARAGLAAAGAWLDRPGRALWVFPQGRHRPPHLRPLDLQRGVEILARTDGVRVVPCALQYVFADAPRPRALVAFGPPMPAGPTVEDVDAALRGGLAHLDTVAEAPDTSLPPFLPARVERDPWSALLARAWRLLA